MRAILTHHRWADVTNISAATRYYPARTDDVGFLLYQDSELRLAFDVSGGVTLTVEWVGHVLNDNDTPATADWLDVTSKCLPMSGAAAASFVDTKNTLVVQLPPGRVRVKIVTADATNAVQLIATVQPIPALGGAGGGAATAAGQVSPTCVSAAAKTAPATPAAATAIATTATANVGVLVAADDANAGTVYVGGSGVTVGTGVSLAAGDSVFLPVNDPAKIYCVGSVAAQVLRVVVL